MRRMSKSAVQVAREALRAGRRALPPYASRYSKHTYTQPQLFALLILKQFLKTDYRGLVPLLAERGELRRAVGLTTVPHYSTLCYAERRLLTGAGKGGPSAPFSTPSSTARRTASQQRETLLRVLTHNLMILPRRTVRISTEQVACRSRHPASRARVTIRICASRTSSVDAWS